RNSSNSSIPPSNNPPDAPKPTPKKPSGRKPGGQPGHPPYPRPRLPPERVTKVIPFVPETCAHCQAPLPAQPAPTNPEPTWPQAEAQEAVRDAKVKNVDETGWKEAGKKRWLWLATTAQVACYLIHTGRGAAGLLALLGGKIKGIIISDRWRVYERIRLGCRQI